MKCPHCGNELPEGFTYSDPESEQSENTTPEETPDFEVMPMTDTTDSLNVVETLKKKERIKLIKKIVVSAIITAAVISIITVSVGMYGKSKLKDHLTGTWQNSTGMMSTSVIEFNENTLSYSESLGFMQINSVTLPYVIENSDTISIQGNDYTITFEDEHTMLISPGLSGSASETWVSDSVQSDDLPADSDTSDDNQNVL